MVADAHDSFSVAGAAFSKSSFGRDIESVKINLECFRTRDHVIADPGHAAKRAELERELARISQAAGPDEMPVYEGITNLLPKY